MSNKRPFIYLGAAIAIAIVILLLERPEEPRIGDVEEGYLLPDYDIELIRRVEMEQLISGAELKRDGDKWTVSEIRTPLKKQLMEKEGRVEKPPRSYRADSSRIKSALGALAGLEKGVLVSDNPERQMLYQVGKGGLNVRGFRTDDKPVFDLIIGKNGPDLVSSYIRPANDNKVYLVRRSLSGIFSPNATDWRERNLWQLEPTEITKIEVKLPKGGYSLTRRDGDEWEVAAKGLVTKLAKLRAEGFADDTPDSDSGLNEPAMVFTLGYGKDKSMSLKIGKKDNDGRYYARLEGDSEIYLIPKDFYESIPQKPPL